MPIYEYQCRQCGDRSEAMQKMADPPISECEECGGELKKLVSAPAFQFKGTGWYVTDYARKDKEKSDSSSESSSESGGSADDSGSDLKKAEKSSEGAAKSTSKSTDKKESTSSTSQRKAGKSS